MNKNLFMKGLIPSFLFIFFLSALVLAQENCIGNLTLDCSIYNESECINNYYYNLDYYQCYFNISECLVNDTNYIFINLTTTTTTTITTTTTTTTTTIYGLSNETGIIRVLIIDITGLFNGRKIYAYQNSNNVSRFIQSINISDNFKLANGVSYEIVVEPKVQDVITNVSNPNWINYMLIWIPSILLILVLLYLGYRFIKK